MIGFIGTGNMASAMIGGIIKSGLYPPSQIIVSDASENALNRLAENHPGIVKAKNNIETTQRATMLILSVKPHIYEPVLREIREEISQETLIITIAAGVTIKKVEELLQRPLKVIRTMPNTPALVGMAMTALCPNKKVTEEELQQVKELFSSFGKAELLPESQINAFTSLCGSSPAWIFMAIEALADGAVLQGIPRDKAYPMVAQAVAGSAKMVLDSGEHPAVLKDRVCSPGGTTIEAVAQLEKDGLRASLIEAVRVCTAKADRLSGD